MRQTVCTVSQIVSQLHCMAILAVLTLVSVLLSDRLASKSDMYSKTLAGQKLRSYICMIWACIHGKRSSDLDGDHGCI